MRTRRGRLALTAVLVLVGGAAAMGAGLITDGRVGPALGLLANGRHLTPQGDLVRIGNFPTGGALTPDGQNYWTLSTGRGANDIRIVSVLNNRVVQTIPMPGLSGGIVMDPRARRVYVSGVQDSEHTDQDLPHAPGRRGDVIHVFEYVPDGPAHETSVIHVPAPGDAPAPENFPPTNVDQKISWPDRLAISPDGSRLLVPLNLADQAAIVDTSNKAVRYVHVGHFPYGAAILRDNRTGLVSNESAGTVSVVDLVGGTVTKTITVGPNLSHPEAIAVDPVADRAYVAIANSDQVAVIDTTTMTVERVLSVGVPEGNGAAPVALAVKPGGGQLLVANSGVDDIAVFGLPHGSSAKTGKASSSVALRSKAEQVLSHEVANGAVPAPAASEADDPEDSPKVAVHAKNEDYPLLGRIPTADYPADVQVTPKTQAGCECPRILYVAAKGLGVGPNPHGPNPYVINDNNANSQNYLPTKVKGLVGRMNYPTPKKLATLTPRAAQQIRPTNAQDPPPGTPLRQNGPIKHVFYVVKENRTYDQVLGDVAKGDGDPHLALFGQKVTPNAHALVSRFPLTDHVYANSEASIDGHFWTSAAKVSDYVHKNWNQNYAARNRPYDFGVFSVTWPFKGFLFDQLDRQGIGYYNYGEAIAGVLTLPALDKDLTAADEANAAVKLAKSDLGPPQGCYPNDAFIFDNAITQAPELDPYPLPSSPVNVESRMNCFRTKFTAQTLTNTVPPFNYLVLPQDHTQGASPGKFTPRAYVARNDLALGELVDLISHSNVWDSSAIFVIEDDSQDGADHVDAHRIPAFVISPYTERGAVVHTRYDFLSVIRSMELILGLHPLGLFDRLATPMYDVFTAKPKNHSPFTTKPATWNLDETNANTKANRAMTHGLNLNNPDRVTQRDLDAQIYKTIFGAKATPPPPGPNAVNEK